MSRILALASVAALAAAQDFAANSYKGKAPPDLESEAGQWFNAKGAVKLSGLKGKVVWLEFGFLN